MTPEEEKPDTEEGEKVEGSVEEQKESQKSGENVLEKEIEEGEERLPFPNARVVAIMRSQLDKEKIIRARVKIEMNEWLGEMCKRISREMNKTPYSVIEVSDFQRAIKKYEQLEEIAKQKERLIVAMQRIIQDAQVLISDIERSFDVK